MTVDSKLRAATSDAGSAERDPRDSAGLLLGRLTVLPALVFLPFLLTSFPLLLFGYFKPVPVVLLWLALAALVVPYAWRRVPSVTGAAVWGTRYQGLAKPTPRWALWSLVAVSVAFGLFNAAFHSQFVIVEYDAASYMQFANWISAHGTTFIPTNSQFFGGLHPSDITFASAATYQVGNHVVLQFMAGLPMVLSLGFWAGGARLAVFWAPVLGALAVFTFGGLVARLVGPRWAPFAALALGVTVPMQYVSRDTWSEPLALIFLIGGLSLWIDSQHADRGQRDPDDDDAAPWRTGWRHHVRSASHVLAGVAGLTLGLVFLIRIDGPADLLFIIPYCGLLVLRRQRQALPFIVGLVVGTLYGALDGAFLTAPYLIPNNTQSVLGMSALVILAFLGTVVAVWWLRRRGAELRNPPKPWLVKAVTMLPIFVVAVFFLRPYVERVGVLEASVLTLHWIYWYTGAITIAFAVIAFSVLGRRCVKGESPVWALPLLVFGWATFVFLARPAITPHQPYASRRLVDAVLPGVILLAVWLASWLAQKSRVLHLVDVPDYLKRSPRVAVIAICAAAIALPPLVGNVGGLAFKRTFAGEIAAMNHLCAGIPKGASVLIIDNNNVDLKFAQAIRGTCDVPVAGVQTTHPGGVLPAVGDTTKPAKIFAAIRDIEESGHTPFLLAYTKAELAPVIKRFGAGIQSVLLDQQTQDDEHIYFGEPRNTVTERFTIYSWRPAK